MLPAFIDLKAQQARLGTRLDAAIARVLEHGRFIMGPEIAALEAELAAFSGARHVITCASGTDALLLALLAKGVGPEDAVLLPSFTFIATAEVVALLGATPVFCDVREDSFNIDPLNLDAGFAAAAAAGLRTVGVIAVDLFGLPADYDALEAWCEERNLWLIADAAQSFGATYKGRRVGQIGTITATSFFPAKPLGCYGDGGAVFTADDDLALIMRSLRVHGQGQDKYDNVRIGINGRLDTLQAAILLEKLAIFADEIEARQRVAERYAQGLADVVRVPEVPAGLRSVWAQYTLRLADATARDRLAATLKAAGVPSAVYYRTPLHRQSAYRHFPTATGGLPVSERLAEQVLSLPMHPYLTEPEQDHVIATIRAALD